MGWKKKKRKKKPVNNLKNRYFYIFSLIAVFITREKINIHIRRRGKKLRKLMNSGKMTKLGLCAPYINNNKQLTF